MNDPFLKFKWFFKEKVPESFNNSTRKWFPYTCLIQSKNREYQIIQAKEQVCKNEHISKVSYKKKYIFNTSPTSTDIKEKHDYWMCIIKIFLHTFFTNFTKKSRLKSLILVLEALQSLYFPIHFLLLSLPFFCCWCYYAQFLNRVEWEI